MNKNAKNASPSRHVLRALKEGNERFRSGDVQNRRSPARPSRSAGPQHPIAAIVGCIDSRAPAEVIFDAGLGDFFNARVAGNVLNPDILGSLEFACRIAGAKLVIVLGHTDCGAVKGAIDGIELGHLTGLLDKIQPAIEETRFVGERSAKNPTFVDAVGVTNVRRTVAGIRQESHTLAEMERAGELIIVGAMYDVESGGVKFLDDES